MKIRVAITIIVLILYVGLFNLYIYDLTRVDIKTSKLFYNYLTFGGLLFFLLDIKAGFVNEYHKQFNLLLVLCILINYIIIILVHSEVLSSKNTWPIFYSFDLSVFAITLTIFICEIRYKTFND